MIPLPARTLALAAALLALALPAPGRAQTLPQADPVPGGIAVVGVGSAAARPEVTFRGRRVLVARRGSTWRAVVGLPLALEPGTHELAVNDGKARSVRFKVRPKRYRAQYLTLQDQRQVEPLPEDLARIERERVVLEQAFATWTDQAPPQLRFELPAEGRFSSEFGLRRFFNNLPRRPHSGIDIAAAEGTPINAPAEGVVIEVGDFFFNGLTVILDHGQGLLSAYNHLSRIGVAKGARVARGAPLGAIGATGRVTGPHLHWSVSLNNVRVDPLLFLARAQRERLVNGPLAGGAKDAPMSDNP